MKKIVIKFLSFSILLVFLVACASEDLAGDAKGGSGKGGKDKTVTQCNDCIDNDLDGLYDTGNCVESGKGKNRVYFDADPGCTDKNDNDENNCANGVIETGEECDDGNTVNGDGCDSNCHIEIVGIDCADADTLCVDDDGDKEYTTIQECADVVQSGQTCLVYQGIYRENVNLENVMGTSSSYITFRANPGDSVVVSGADILSDWNQCTPTTCPSHPNLASIWYASTSRVPFILAEAGVLLNRARTDGWWVSESSNNTAIIDSVHLCNSCIPGITQQDDYWVGGRITKYVKSTRIPITREITGSSESNNEISSNSMSSSGDGDIYYLENKYELLDGPGQWVFNRTPVKPYKVFVWPRNGVDEISVNTRINGFDLANSQYVVIDGFEVRMASKRGISTEVGSESIKILNNNIHSNYKGGVLLRDSNNTVIENNNISNNLFRGITGGHNSIIRNNKIINNLDDGIAGIFSGTIIENNLIKGHKVNSHPDGIQVESGVTKHDIWIVNNTLIDNWQSIMLADTENGHIINNTIVGGRIIFGHGTANNWEINGNNLMITGAPYIAAYESLGFDPGGHDYTIKSNLFYLASPGSAYKINPANNFLSDFNIFHKPANTPNYIIEYDGIQYGGGSVNTFGDYQTVSGQDLNSLEQDPLFANVPSCIEEAYSQISIDYGDMSSITPSRLYLKNDFNACFNSGDNIEVQHDGVLRNVDSVGNDLIGYFIDISPSINQETLEERDIIIFNWKTETDFTLDFT